MNLIETSASLRDDVSALIFCAPITHVYNPLQYAWRPHREYLRLFGAKKKRIILLGMNPGPWGMAQTGVPFGDVTMIRDWMGIDKPVDKQEQEHPKRPIQGFQCQRNEVSGSRLWGWAQDRFGTPEAFFARFFVYNYCPLSFMEESGRNFTPDKLPGAERDVLFELCDQALQRVVACLQPTHVVGVGTFAEKRIRQALPDFEGHVGRILHPSPASPVANRGWAAAAEADFEKCGIRL
jgi:single-strand selective monofunctional uracil DNA glycosylase